MAAKHKQAPIDRPRSAEPDRVDPRAGTDVLRNPAVGLDAADARRTARADEIDAALDDILTRRAALLRRLADA